MSGATKAGECEDFSHCSSAAHDEADECISHHVQEEDLQTEIIRTQHFDHSITVGEGEVGQ